jgi:hypothetical protein
MNLLNKWKKMIEAGHVAYIIGGIIILISTILSWRSATYFALSICFLAMSFIVAEWLHLHECTGHCQRAVSILIGSARAITAGMVFFFSGMLAVHTKGIHLAEDALKQSLIVFVNSNPPARDSALWPIWEKASKVPPQIRSTLVDGNLVVVLRGDPESLGLSGSEAFTVIATQVLAWIEQVAPIALVIGFAAFMGAVLARYVVPPTSGEITPTAAATA